MKVALTAKTLTTSTYRVGVYWNTTEVFESTVFTVDTTAPSFTVHSWQNRTFKASDVSLNFTVDESVNGLFYCLDGNDSVTFNVNIGKTHIYGREYYCAVFGNLEEGSHSLTIYANDADGNTGKSETYFFTVNTPAITPSPSPSLSSNPAEFRSNSLKAGYECGLAILFFPDNTTHALDGAVIAATRKPI